MKTLPFLCIAFWVCMGQSAVAQAPTEDFSPFRITIERQDNGVKMTCEQGCAWTELTFSLPPFKPQAVNAFGMTKQNDSPSATDDSVADFLFTVKSEENVLSLEGIKGSAWINLSFTLSRNQKHTITPYGVEPKP